MANNGIITGYTIYIHLPPGAGFCNHPQLITYYYENIVNYQVLQMPRPRLRKGEHVAEEELAEHQAWSKLGLAATKSSIPTQPQRQQQQQQQQQQQGQW